MRSTAYAARHDARGAVFVEKLIAYLPLLLAFFLTWELAELGAASLVVQRASSAAGRAAIVVLPDDPAFYGGEPPDQYEGARRADIELAAGMVLSAVPQLASDFTVEVSEPPHGTSTLEVTVEARFRCGSLGMMCGLDESITLSSTTTHAYQGAAYAYATPTGAGGTDLAGGSQALAAEPSTGRVAPDPPDRLRSGRAGGSSSGGQRPGGGQNCDPDCPPGDNGLLAPQGGARIPNTRDGEWRSSREAATVLLTARDAYKVYTNRVQAERALDEYRDARRAGVRVPDYRLFPAKWRNNGRCTDVWVLQTDRAQGRFFQLSNSGLTSALLNEASSDGPVASRRVVRQLMTAYCYGVTDPQGFYDPDRNPPLTFIDIHRSGGTHGAGALLDAAQRLNARLPAGYRSSTDCADYD